MRSVTEALARWVKGLRDTPETADGPQLLAPYPNPFTIQSRLAFTLPHPEHVQLSIYDVLGRRVVDVLDEWRPAGSHEALVDRGALPSGTYVVVLHAGPRRSTRLLVTAE